MNKSILYIFGVWLVLLTLVVLINSPLLVGGLLTPPGGGLLSPGGGVQRTGETVTLINTADLVGIGTSTPYATLSVSASTTAAALAIRQVDSGNQGDIAHFFDGVTEVMRLNTAGRLGLGTTSPSALLSIQASSTEPALAVRQVDSGNQGHIASFFDGITEVMRISAAGRLGLGTTSPATVLSVSTPATTTIYLDSTSGTQGTCIKMKNATGTDYTYMWVGYGVATFTTVSCE